MNRDWCIPLPPDATASAAKGETKQAVGLYPCINAGHCSEFILIKLDRKGLPYGTCSPGEVNIRGCKVRCVKGAREDIPEQTYDTSTDSWTSKLLILPSGSITTSERSVPSQFLEKPS